MELTCSCELFTRHKNNNIGRNLQNESWSSLETKIMPLTKEERHIPFILPFFGWKFSNCSIFYDEVYHPDHLMAYLETL